MRRAIATSIFAIVCATAVVALGGTSSRAAFPGTNGAVYFSSEGSGGTFSIFSRPAAGGARTQLTSPVGGADHSPAVSPDGTKVAFKRFADVEADDGIWIMNADGSDLQMVPNTVNGNSPVWRPDGEHLLFSLAGNSIFEIHPDGSELINLTPTLARAEDPAASPDGTRIAFIVLDEDESHLYVMNADGSDPAPLTPPNGLQESDPDWSPNSFQIVFGSHDRDTGDFDVHRIDADGNGTTNLTSDIAGNQTAGAFSPDGEKIVYQEPTVNLSSAGVYPAGIGPTQLFTMNIDRSNQQNFTQDSLLIEIQPDWGPAQATPTPSPTPTDPPGIELMWGNWDCDTGVSTRDNQATLRHVLQQNPLGQTEPCPDIGLSLDFTVPTSGQVELWGDADCDNAITTRDNQAILRNVLEQTPLSQTEPCPDVRSPVIVSVPG